MSAQSPTPRDEARKMLADAAALCGWCADFWRDETDHYSNGVRIHYAVDVDVIMMYADAENNRVYGRVF